MKRDFKLTRLLENWLLKLVEIIKIIQEFTFIFREKMAFKLICLVRKLIKKLTKAESLSGKIRLQMNTPR